MRNITKTMQMIHKMQPQQAQAATRPAHSTGISNEGHGKNADAASAKYDHLQHLHSFKHLVYH